MNFEQAWTEKYRPQTLDDLCIDPNTAKTLQAWVDKGTLQNMMLSGTAGIGKTTLAKVLTTAINADVKYINASDDNGIDFIRDTVKTFTETAAMFGELKVVIFDEADGLSKHAQDALRNIIETSMEDTRFIMTCNNISDIIDPIRSRCPELYVKHDAKLVTKRLVQIVKLEGITLAANTVKAIHNDITNVYYPDVRKCVNALERSFITGTYKPIIDVSVGLDGIVYTLLDMLDEVTDKSLKGIKEIRKHWINNEGEFSGDYIKLGSTLLEAIVADDAYKGNIALAIKLSDDLYKLNQVADVELQFYCMFMRIAAANFK